MARYKTPSDVVLAEHSLYFIVELAAWAYAKK